VSTFHIFWTIALFAIFVGIFIWAWSGRKKKDFDEAAQLPLMDEFPLDDSGISNQTNTEANNG